MWITLNEPSVTTWNGYGTGEHAPGMKDPLGTTFKVAHNLLRSHTKAWHTYNRQFRSKQKGTVKFLLSSILNIICTLSPASQ